LGDVEEDTTYNITTTSPSRNCEMEIEIVRCPDYASFDQIKSDRKLINYYFPSVIIHFDSISFADFSLGMRPMRPCMLVDFFCRIHFWTSRGT